MTNKSITLKESVPKSVRWRSYAIEGIVAILLIIWLHTGISKLMEWRGFNIQMHQNPVFYKYADFVTFAGPILEIVLAALLIFKRTRLFGMIGSFLLMTFFTGYVIYLMTAWEQLPCACGGVFRFLTWPQHLVLNIFLMVIAFFGVILIRKQKRSAV